MIAGGILLYLTRRRPRQGKETALDVAHNHEAAVDSTNIGVLFALISILYIIAVFISVQKQHWKKVVFPCISFYYWCNVCGVFLLSTMRFFFFVVG